MSRTWKSATVLCGAVILAAVVASPAAAGCVGSAVPSIAAGPHAAAASGRQGRVGVRRGSSVCRTRLRRRGVNRRALAVCLHLEGQRRGAVPHRRRGPARCGLRAVAQRRDRNHELVPRSRNQQLLSRDMEESRRSHVPAQSFRAELGQHGEAVHADRRRGELFRRSHQHSRGYRPRSARQRVLWHRYDRPVRRRESLDVPPDGDRLRTPHHGRLTAEPPASGRRAASGRGPLDRSRVAPQRLPMPRESPGKS